MVCAERDERQHVKFHRRADEAGIIGYASLLGRDFTAPIQCACLLLYRRGSRPGVAWPETRGLISPERGVIGSDRIGVGFVRLREVTWSVREHEHNGKEKRPVCLA